MLSTWKTARQCRWGNGAEWPIAGSLGRYRHVFADPESGQVAAITTVTENGVGVIYIVRLSVEEDGRISEIETQITRDAGGAAIYEKMGGPEAVWLEAVPVAQRISRAKLISQTNLYYSGMQNNDPKGNYSFFDKDCNRLEDGVQTTNIKTGDPYGHSNDTAFASLGCEAQFQTGFLGFVTKIRDRRYSVVDEERQAVLAITTLDHNGTVRSLPSVNGTSSPIPAYFDVPRTLLAAEVFRLRGDKLLRIEMTLTEVPYGTRYAFHDDEDEDDDDDDDPAAAPGADLAGVDQAEAGGEALAPSPWTRAYLDTILRQTLRAMVAHDFTGLPLEEDAVYSENGQFIALGDGLWETLGQVDVPGADGSYAATYADQASGTAAYWGLSREQTTPGVLALRIKVDIDSGRISEVEAIAIRAESSGPRGGTMTLMRPPLPVEWQGASPGPLDPAFLGRHAPRRRRAAARVPPGLVDAYFDGLERHSSTGVPFARGCLRRHNALGQGSLGCAAQMSGEGAAPNGLHGATAAVRDRRVLVADGEGGVVVVVAMVDDPARARHVHDPPADQGREWVYISCRGHGQVDALWLCLCVGGERDGGMMRLYDTWGFQCSG